MKTFFVTTVFENHFKNLLLQPSKIKWNLGHFWHESPNTPDSFGNLANVNHINIIYGLNIQIGDIL